MEVGGVGPGLTRIFFFKHPKIAVKYLGVVYRYSVCMHC